MEFFDGYSYRINIVKEDSSILVDSATGIIRGHIADCDENIIVDTATKSFYGTLIGNLSDRDLNVVFDINEKIIKVESIVSNTIKGNLVNEDNKVIVNNKTNSIFVSSIEGADLKNVTFGSAISPIDYQFYVNSNLLINTTINYNKQDQTVISVNYQRGSLEFPKNVKAGDLTSLFKSNAYYNHEYKKVGTIGFIVDPDLKKSEQINNIPSYFIVTPCSRDLNSKVYLNKINTNHPVFKESLTFGMGILSAPIFKVGTHTDQNKINAQKGMIMFNDSIKKFQGYTGTKWVDLH